MLSISACLGCGEVPEDRKECKLRLSIPSSTVKKGVSHFRIMLEVTKGRCKVSDYTLLIKNKEAFQNDNWTVPQLDRNKQTVLLTGQNEKTLQQWLNIEKATFKKGEKKKITIEVTVHKQGGSSIFEFLILNKAKTVVAGPLQVRWTLAN